MWARVWPRSCSRVANFKPIYAIDLSESKLNVSSNEDAAAPAAAAHFSVDIPAAKPFLFASAAPWFFISKKNNFSVFHDSFYAKLTIRNSIKAQNAF